MSEENMKIVFSVQELAQALGIGKAKAYDMTHIEGFPVLVVGRRRLIPKAAFEKWLMERGCNEGTNRDYKII